MKVQLALTLLATTLCLPGCGDDAAVSSDLSVRLDMAVASGDLAGGPTCAAYCALVTMNCKASGDGGAGNVQYMTEQDCNTYCTTYGAFPTGTKADATGNTLGCRQYHAGTPAATTPGTHCPHAGPSGGGTCGSYCENLCQLALKNCTGANAVVGLPTDEAGCVAACVAANVSSTGAINSTTGNTLQCRIYHLGKLAATDPVTHCQHGRLTANTQCL